MIIGLKDFRYHAMNNNKRIYYFINDPIINLYFITEGMLIKSFVNINDVDNREKFFSDDMFMGATRLLFNIPLLPKESIIPGISPLPIMEEDLIEENKHVELENRDLQKEGVNMEE